MLEQELEAVRAEAIAKGAIDVRFKFYPHPVNKKSTVTKDGFVVFDVEVVLCKGCGWNLEAVMGEEKFTRLGVGGTQAHCLEDARSNLSKMSKLFGLTPVL